MLNEAACPSLSRALGKYSGKSRFFLSKKKLFVVFILLITHYSLLIAQSGWVWQNPSTFTNNIKAVRFLNNNTGWCFGDYKTNYKTTDGGNNWNLFNLSTFQDIYYSTSYKFDSINTTFYLGGSTGSLFISSNSGINWFTKNLPTTYFITHIFFINLNTGYVSAGHLYKTTNGGNNWTISAVSSSNLVYKSTFFLNDSIGWMTGYRYTFMSYPLSEFYVYKTINSGNNWSSIYYAWNLDQDAPPLNIIFKDTLCGLVKYNNRIYQTTNSGTNWTNIYNIGIFEFINNSTGFVAGNNAFAKTTNFGSNWIPRNYVSNFQANCINVLDTSIIFVGGNNGILIKTINGGYNWTNLQKSVTNKNIKYIKAIDSLNLFALAPNNTLLKTTNGGNIWTCLDSIIFTGNSINTSFILNASTGWFGTNSGTILKTTNMGINWLVSTVSENVKKIYISNSGYGYAFGNTKIFKTSNFGDNWIYTSQFNNVNIYDISFPSLLIGYAAIYNNSSSNAAIFKTSDGGFNWSVIYSYPAGGLFVHLIKFINDSVGYSDVNLIYNSYPVNTTHNINKTTNYGLNWVSVLSYEEPIINTEYYNDIVCLGNNCIYLVDRLGGFRASTNSGTSWQYTNLTTSRLSSITSFGKNIWVAGDNGTIIKGNNIISVGIKNNELILPITHMLFQNYPNPFNPVTKIKFSIPSDVRREMSNVKLIIYDILGKEITTLVNEKLNPGTYEVTFDGSNYASGIYFYQLRAGEFLDTKKLVLLK